MSFMYCNLSKFIKYFLYLLYKKDIIAIVFDIYIYITNRIIFLKKKMIDWYSRYN